LNSFPGLHGEKVRMVGIPGSPPSLRAMPSGCKFHPRCPHVADSCKGAEPPLATPAGSYSARTVACTLQDGSRTPPAALALPDPDATPARHAASVAPLADPSTNLTVGDLS